ncbi:hypothetical protein LTS08_007565 [Lithohypha guttulata]|nr:hypothetical protein LTS08_007565 [Lithohypha guttulata]
MDECKLDEESADSFMLKIDMEEDVGAEVEDFVLYARLGLVDDAIAVIHEVLWRHLLFFPALAEIGLFLIEEDNTKELQLMLELLRRQNFTAVLEAEETRFVDVLNTLLPPGEPAVTSLRNLGPDRCSLLYDKTRDPGVKDRSPIQIQLDQIRFNIFSLCSLSLKDFFSSAREEFLRLLSDNLFWEGTCLFKLCCRAIEDLPVDLTWQQIFEQLITMYAETMQAVDEQMLLTVPKADIDGYIPEVTCCLVAKLSCFQAINALRKHGFSFEDAEGFALLIRARQMMDTLLQFLPDDKLRGKYASCLDKVRIPEIDANTDDPHTLMAWSQWDDLIRSRPRAASGQSNASSITSSELSSVFSRPRLKRATKSISDMSMSTSVDAYAESSSTVTSKLLHSGIGNELPTHQGPDTYEQPRISTSKVLEDAYEYQPSQSRSESSQLRRHETRNVSYTMSNRFPPEARHTRTDATPEEEVVENPTSGQMAPEQYDEDFPFTTLTTPLLRDFARIAIYELDERIEYLENHILLLAKETIARVQTDFLRQAVEFWRMDKAIASASCSYCLAPALVFAK